MEYLVGIGIAALFLLLSAAVKKLCKRYLQTINKKEDRSNG